MATKGVELASAYISLNVRTDEIAPAIKKALNDSTRSVDTVGRDMGRQMVSGVSREVSSGGQRIGRELARTVGAQGDEAGRKFMQEFRTPAERAGAGIGLVIGRSIAGGIDLTRSVGSKLESSAATIGKRVGHTLATGITSALAFGGIGSIGAVLFSGFERLEKIDAAKYKLDALNDTLKRSGKPLLNVKQTIQDVTDTVTGTPFALDQAFDTAVQAIGTGVKDIKRFMKDVADAAGFAGKPLDQLGLVFNQVAAKGKLQGDEMMQLMEAGLPAKSWIQESYNLTSDQFDDMQAKGELTLDMLEKSIEDHAGGMAAKLGNSLSGAVDNMKTSVARVGADLLTSLFGGTTGDTSTLTNSINGITTKLNDVDTWVKAHSGEIHDFFLDMKNVAGDVATAVGKVGEFLKEHPRLIEVVAGVFVAKWTVGLVAPLVGALKGMSTLLRVTLPADAAAGAAGMSAALIPVLALASSVYAITDGRPQDYVGGGPKSPKAAADNKDWGRVLFGDAANWPGEVRNWFKGDQGPNIPGGGGPDAQRQRRGAGATNALDPGFFLGGPGAPQLGGGGNSLPGTGTYGLPRGSNSGGYGGGGVKFPDWVNQIANAFGIKPSTYPGHQETNRNEAGFAPNPQDLNRAIDWTGSPDALQRFADYLSTIPGDLEQVIWQNPASGQRVGIAGGRDVSGSGYYANDYGAHTNHVHTRQSMPLPLPPWMMPAYATGGAARGPGGPKGDQIPAMLSDNEHVLTSDDVNAMGGQSGVYAFRNGLHRAGGGSVQLMDLIQGNVPIDPSLLPGGGRGTRKRITWWGGEDGLPPINTDPNAPILPIPGKPGQAPPNIFGGMPGEWPPNNNFPKPGDPRWIARQNREGVGALGFADGGEVDPNLLLQQLMGGAPGVDPNTLIHGQGQGQPPGPVGADGQPAPTSDVQAAGRTEGYIPAGAGFSGKTGAGVVGGFVNIGAEAIKGVIQGAADLGKMAASAALTAGTFGAGAAGGPAAGAGIQMGADIAKRGVQYGADMINTGIGGLTEILSPFGAPRWLSDVDPTSFIPQNAISPATPTTNEGQQLRAFTSTGEPFTRAGADQTINQFSAAAGIPSPNTPWQGPDPYADPNTPSNPPPPAMSSANEQPQQKNPLDFMSILKGGIFDSGGTLEPNMVGINLSKRPEHVLTQSQMDGVKANAAQPGGGRTAPLVGTLQALNMDDAIRELRKVERRESRPRMRGKAGL
jgi:tape measure domain-containing protein